MHFLLTLLLSAIVGLGCSSAAKPQPDAGPPVSDGGGSDDGGAPDVGSLDGGGSRDGGASDGGGDGGEAFPLLGVYTAALDGGQLTLLVDAQARELSHVRRLGTTRWLVATRYGLDPDHNGLAMEDEIGVGPSYSGTEVVVFPMDAPTELTVLTGTPDAGMAANASWTEDGKVLFVRAEPGAASSLVRLTVSLSPLPSVTAEETIALPAQLASPVDPHQSGPSDGGRVVFSAWYLHTSDGGSLWMRPVWMAPATGAASLGQVTAVGCPICPAQGGCCGWAALKDVLGTNDARMNHAGTEVAWMQQHPSVSFPAGAGTAYPWRQAKRPLDGGTQVDLAPSGTSSTTSNAYAEWSPDDRLLAFWSIEAVDGVVKHFVNLMGADGSGRVRVPLPDVLCPQHVSFLDAEHLVFNAWRCGAADAGCSCDVAYVRR